MNDDIPEAVAAMPCAVLEKTRRELLAKRDGLHMQMRTVNDRLDPVGRESLRRHGCGCDRKGGEECSDCHVPKACGADCTRYA